MEIDQSVATILADYPQATVAISVRDDHRSISYDLNQDTVFHAASTMKVPVMIEVFRRVHSGALSLDDSLLVENAFRSIVDGSIYAIEDDTDDSIYERLGTRMSIRDLVFQMITVSSNLATNILIDHLSAESVQKTAESLGVETMRVLRGVEDIKAFRQGLSNTATSRDLAVLLSRLASGTAVSEAIDRQMVAIMEAQQFNEMIPAGLPAATTVAHKTGQITEIHHDAAIVDVGKNPYVLVIMTRGIADENRSATLGARIAAGVHTALRSTGGP